MNITICGAGNAAHTLIPVLATSAAPTLTVFTALPDEVARWHAALAGGQQVEAALGYGRVWRGAPNVITADPALAAADADVVLLALPAFAHEAVLAALAPHLPPTAWIVALPARGGFDWLARRQLPAQRGVICGLQTLPWACRIRRWGRQVEVLGIKHTVDLAAWPADASVEAARRLTQWLGVAIQPAASFLALTLANTGQIIHPGIMAGLFRRWDGRLLAEVPLFYGGVDEETAQLLQALSDDIQAVRAALHRAAPQLDLSAVLPLHAWLRRAYAGQIADDSTLRAAFIPDRAYQLLASVGIVDSNGDGKLEHNGQPWGFVVDSLDMHRSLAEAVVAQLQEAGIDASLRLWEASVVRPLLQAGERTAYLDQWGDSAFDPVGHMEAKWHGVVAGSPYGRGNFSGYNNERVNELIKAGETETDEAKRRTIYYEAQAILYDEAPAVFLILPEEVEASSARITNWEPASDSRINLHDVCLQ